MPQTRSSDITLTVALLASAFASLTAAVYVVAQTQPVPIVELFLGYGPLLAVILWLQRDVARTGVGAVFDLGYFLMIAWPIVIPWYAFRTRGWRGWRLVLGLFGVIVAPYVAASVVDVLIWQFNSAG